MKKMNNKSTEAAEVKVRRQKKMTTFFLYVEGRGFVRSDANGMPNFDNGDLVKFNTRAKAKFAREFFITLKVAESIDIFAKVA